MAKIRVLLSLFALILTTFWAFPAYSQRASITLTAGDMMKIVIENIEQNDALKTILVSFERKKTEYELNRSGNCKAWDNDGKCISILTEEVSKHGELYPPEERGDNGGLSINFSKILALGYDYLFVDSNGPYYQNLLAKYKFVCNCYIVWFGPKEIIPSMEDIAPPEAGRIEKGIHETAIRMSGIIYVDKKHLFIRKYIGGLSKSFNMIGGAARITMASMDLSQEIRPDWNNTALFTSTEIMYQVRKAWGVFGYQTRRLVWEWSNYRLNSDNPSR